ncbi:MAG: MFS transporter [Cytophagales bacterium]|nr:MFS transporter [Cytophagales bacterium]
MIRRLYIYVNNPVHLSAGCTFFILGTLFSFWVTRIPGVKEKLELSDGALGIALFFIPLGAIISMLVSARMIHTIGEGKTTLYALLFFCMVILAPVMAVDFISLCVALFFLGFSMGWLDIAMNAVVNTIEKKEMISIMSTTHGFYSLGGIAGGGIGGLLAGLGVNPILHFTVSGLIVLLVALLFIRKHVGDIRDDKTRDPVPLFALPRAPVMGLAVIAFCIMIGEGAVADWSTVYLDEFLSSGAMLAGLGYAGFSLTMTLGRFNGDYYIQKYGRSKVILFGITVAIAGILLLLTAKIAWVIIGFTLVGMGYSCIIPVLFSSAAKVVGINPAYGLASVASAGYFGFLIGPVIIGLIAEMYGLNNSFLLLLLLTLVALAWAKRSFNVTAQKK